MDVTVDVNGIDRDTVSVVIQRISEPMIPFEISEAYAVESAGTELLELVEKVGEPSAFVLKYPAGWAVATSNTFRKTEVRSNPEFNGIVHADHRDPIVERRALGQMANGVL